MNARTAAGLALAAVVVASGCASDANTRGAATTTTPTTPTTSTATSSGRTVRVPGDHPTIQAGVDAAGPGGLVLVAAGTYHESLRLGVPRVTVRGLDRATVVLDGADSLDDGVVVTADGVTVENLTVHHYRRDGVRFAGDAASGRPLTGYRARYVTAYDNGRDGVAAADARGGTIDHVSVSGHPGAGVSIARCYPCRTVVSDVRSRFDAVGLRTTNAGGELYVVGSRFERDRVGIEAVSSAVEDLYPQRDATFVANLVTGAGDPDAAAPASPDPAFGTGITVRGGRTNDIERNAVRDSAGAGITVTSLDRFVPEANRVVDNVLGGNLVDLAYVVAGGSQHTNCFHGNRFSTSSPPDIENGVGCTVEAMGGIGVEPTVARASGRDHRSITPPEAGPSLPDAASAPASTAPERPARPDLGSLAAPEP